MTVSSLNNEIKKPSSKVFRRLYIKRRDATTGVFEADWLEITTDVKRWGSINSHMDYERFGKLSFATANITMHNKDGAYNPETEETSLWYGYASQQRTLVKIEAGFYFQYQSAGGIWTTEEFPTDPTIFVGIISGNIRYSDEDEITLPIKPLTQVFRDFSAADGPAFRFASTYITGLRDMTLGGQYVFRPFFGNTTTYWEIATSTEIFWTIPAADLNDMSVWDVIEKIAERIYFIPYISRDGKFKWGPRQVASTTAFEFHGLNITPNTEYGHTIKKILSFGPKHTNYYSRVSFKYVDADTTTSFVTTSTTLAINGTNNAWNIGQRTFRIDNFLAETGTATAYSITGAIFDEVSSLNNEINFSTSFIPHLELQDRVSITYDGNYYLRAEAAWDANNWDEFNWDEGVDGGIYLQDVDFKLLSVNHNLDTLESRFVAKQL
jgi:hypothetical protein